jgi:Phage tail tube protein, TTP
MARTAVNGSTLSIAATFGATKTMSAVSNASSAIATLEAAHGVSTNDILQVVSSGWSKLIDRVAKVTGVATNDVTLGGIDTSNTSDYPTGSGAGTVREVATWTQVAQIHTDTLQPSGGAPTKQSFQYLDQLQATEEFVGEEPSSIQFEIDDDPTLGGQILLETLTASRESRPFLFTAPNGYKLYGAGTFFISSAPILRPNLSWRRIVTVSYKGRTSQYTS